MTKAKPPAAPSAEPGSEAPPPPAAPPVSPPDRDGDGNPGGSVALEPYALLLADLGEIQRGTVVFGPADAVDALIAAEGARAATPADIDLAGPLARRLPET